MESRTQYASDLTDRQWQIIRQLLPTIATRSEADLQKAGGQCNPLFGENRLSVANAAR